MTGTKAIEFGNAATLSDFYPLPAGNDQYPAEYVEKNRIVKLREDEEIVEVGIAGSPNESLLYRIATFHSKNVRYYAIDPAEFSSYLGRKASGVETEIDGKIASRDERLLLDRIANDAPNVNLVNSIILDAIRASASDIHIEPHRDAVRIRYRIDGVLKTVARYEKSRFAAIASRIKVMSDLNVMERRLPQDGRISVHFGEETVDLRVSIVPVKNGESIVLRLFNRHAYELQIGDLGFEDTIIGLLEGFARTSSGLVVLSGPTGSGKTTTLYAMIRKLNRDDIKIITIEDPVENLIDGVDQIQIQETIGLSFDTILRRVLRQDPNIIMVGEIRDSPTAILAVRAALTGHLVLSTVHTNDAASIVTRFINLGVEPFLLSSVLRGGIAQRLVRKLCDSCKKPRGSTEAERVFAERTGIELHEVWTAVGCDACEGSGFRGRFALGEGFAVDDTIRGLISNTLGDAEFRTHLRSRKIPSLLTVGCRRVADGSTTLAEIERAVSLS